MGRHRFGKLGKAHQERIDEERKISVHHIIAESKRLHPDEIEKMTIDSLWTLFGKEFFDYEDEQKSITKRVIAENLEIIKEKLFLEIIKREKDHQMFSKTPSLGNPIIDGIENLLKGIEKNEVVDEKSAMSQIDFHLKLVSEIFGEKFPSKRLTSHFERVLKARKKLLGK